MRNEGSVCEMRDLKNMCNGSPMPTSTLTDEPLNESGRAYDNRATLTEESCSRSGHACDKRDSKLKFSKLKVHTTCTFNLHAHIITE